MSATHTEPLDVLRRAETLDRLDDRRMRKAIAEGSWVAITSGVFIRREDWDALTPIQRHRVRVAEVLRRRRTGVTLSHFAAAAMWGIDILGPWPETVDVTVARTSGGRSSGGIRRRTRDIRTLQRVPWDEHWITTPAQTALDLARTERFAAAVAIVDQAIWTARPGGALTDIAAIARRRLEDPGHAGDSRALRVLDAAEPLAANVRESHNRVVIAQLGFPRPRLQEHRVLRTGREVFADLYFPTHDHWCEIDGRAKYRDPIFLHGRTPAQAVIDEKNRENEIRREVRAFSRWEATDADHPRRIYDILTAAGLPSSRPRPSR